MFFIGLGLSAFAAVLQETFYFKPQVIYVSTMFLTVLSYALGEGMAAFIPRWGPVGRFLNPGPFNKKEHAASVLMASAAAVSALSTEALAVQKLFYGGYPSAAAGIFITMSSQLIGYGIAGMMRNALVFPTKMLYPINLPITSVLELLHHADKSDTKRRLKVFWIVFAALFFWEFLPEYIFPLLTGVSVFCLAKQNSLVFTNLFGGAQGNEGMGLFSLCFDWNYVAGFGSPLFMPLQTLINSYIGYMIGIALSMALYYSNVWNAQNFPFMSQLLFFDNSTYDNFEPYNLDLIFDNSGDFHINSTAIDFYGVPNLTATYVQYLIVTGVGITATIVHMFLWNYTDIRKGWTFVNMANIKAMAKPGTYNFWKLSGARTPEEKQKILDDPEIDPHYKKMVDYDEVPDSWYLLVFVLSFIVSIVCLYVMKSTLPWWGLILGLVMTAVFTLFFGAQYAITGFGFNLQPIFQMLAGYMFPLRPLANMYFTTYTYNTLSQAYLLLRDLKLAQHNKLSPKVAFTTQIIGCLFGALLNYVMMLSIVKNQAAILISIEGTNIWSGSNIQYFNSQAIAWAIAPKIFSIGAKYQWVTIGYLIGFFVPLPLYLMHRFFPTQRIWSYLNTSIITWYLGYLFIGINSSITIYYIIGVFGQYYLRRYRPKYFVKWNYLISAAMDGGTQVLVFLLTFAVNGGSGAAHYFPAWAGNHEDNLDFCMYNPANG